MRAYGLAIALVAGSWAQAATARDEPAPPESPIVAKLAACRAIAAADERLACFDRAAAEFDTAVQSGQVAVVDREAVKKTRRGLFGFGSSIANLFKPLLGKSADEPEEEQIKRLETTVESFGTTREGGWRITFTEGGTWEQSGTDTFVMSPRVGQKAVITRGMVGTFFVSVNRQPGIRMKRVQ